MAETPDWFICCAEGVVPLSVVYAQLYQQALELARSPRIAEARALLGISEDVYARRYCAQFGFGGYEIVTGTGTATNANDSIAVMPYAQERGQAI